MTTTAIITASAAASISSVQTVAAGTTTTLAAIGLTGQDGPIRIEIPNAAANSFEDLWYADDNSKTRRAELFSPSNTIRLTGPLDYRINKPATLNAVEVVEYT